MSLHSIVSRGFRGPTDAAVSAPNLHRLPVRAQLRRVRQVESMPILETALALGAIGTAVLLNLAR